MSVAVIIAVVMVAVIVVALVVVVVRRQAEQRQVVRDRMASAATGHRQEADALGRQGSGTGPGSPRFCAGRPPRPPLPPSWRSRAPRNWTLAPRKPSNGRFARAKAPAVTMPRRLS